MPTKKDAVWILAGMVLVLAAAVLHVSFYDHLITKRYSIARLQDCYQDILKEYTRLQLRYEWLRSPARIQEVSTRRLSMFQPQEFMILDAQPHKARRDTIHVAALKPGEENRR